MTNPTGGQDNGAAAAPVKTEKQLKKEAEKAAKLAKLQEKLNKKQQQEQQAAEKPKTEVRYISENCIMLMVLLT